MSPRIIPASIAIRFSHVTPHNKELFENDFHQCVQPHIDPMREWIGMQEARGHIDESEKSMMLLMAELFKKMERIEQRILGNDPDGSIPFEHQTSLFGLSYEHLQFHDELLSVNESYYAKIFIPVFPQHPISFFFEALDGRLGAISLMHVNDRGTWDRYTMGRERALLSELRGAQ